MPENSPFAQQRRFRRDTYSAKENAGRPVISPHEVKSTERNSLSRGILDLMKNYSECSFILTCRYEDYNEKYFEENDQIVTYKLCDFNEKEIKKYTNNWKCEKIYPELQINNFLLCLEKRTSIKPLSKNPLMLSMILDLYTKVEDRLPHSRGEFYEMHTKYIMEKSEVSKEYQKCLYHISWDMSCKGELEIPRNRFVEEISNYLKEGIDKSENILEKFISTGYLTKLESDRIESYKFLHSTFQEYLAACYINDLQENNIKNSNNDTKKLSEYENKLLAEYKNNERWKETVKLYCNISKSDISQFLLSIHELDKQNQEKESTVALESLADIRNYIPNITDATKEILDDYYYKSINDWGENIQKAIGLIISTYNKKDSDRPIGKKVFDWITLQLNDNSLTSVKSKNLFYALAYSYIKESSELLVKYYSSKNNRAILDAFGKMGDLAIYHLGEIAVHDKNALECLFKIIERENAKTKEEKDTTEENTIKENVIRELVKLIWKENDISYTAAWYLSSTENISLLNRISNKEGFEEDFDYIKKLNSNTINHIWEPFCSKDRCLYKIMGRIGYLLYNTDENVQIPSVFIDPHIAIPLLIESRERKEQKHIVTLHTDKKIYAEFDEILHEEKISIANRLRMEWLNVKSRGKDGYIFEENIDQGKLYFFMFFVIIFLFVFSSLEMLTIDSMFLLIPILAAGVAFIVSIVKGYPKIDTDIYNDNQYMKIGLTSRYELVLYLSLLAAPFLVVSFAKNHLQKTFVLLILMDLFLLLSANMTVWMRFKKIESKSIFSIIFEKLKRIKK